MDTFMDKLAQKLNAQEMIKANSAADAEEMDQLKNQLREYDECLAQMQQVEPMTEELVDEKSLSRHEVGRGDDDPFHDMERVSVSVQWESPRLSPPMRLTSLTSR